MEEEEEKEEAYKAQSRDMGDYRTPSQDYKDQLELETLAEQLWSNLGEVEDVPQLHSLPAPLREVLLQYRKVFATNLSSERKMHCEPVKVRLREGEGAPRPSYRSKPTPYFWVEQT